MKKEINQRSDNELIFRCDCGGNHFVSFAYDKDDDYMEFWVEVSDQPNSFWWRLRDGLKYIFRGGKNIWHSVGLTSSDLEKVKKLIDEYLEKVKK